MQRTGPRLGRARQLAAVVTAAEEGDVYGRHPNRDKPSRGFRKRVSDCGASASPRKVSIGIRVALVPIQTQVLI